MNFSVFADIMTAVVMLGGAIGGIVCVYVKMQMESIKVLIMKRDEASKKDINERFEKVGIRIGEMGDDVSELKSDVRNLKSDVGNLKK